jgi:colanic acid/amylovoran biosynthesis protein
MIVEVAGVSTRNKGAELMLIAIAEHFASRAGEIQLAVDVDFGSYDDRARYGLRTVMHRVPYRKRAFLRVALSHWLMPPQLQVAYGLVAERNIDVVLDASGFAFGDQLGAKRSEEFAESVTRWRAAGKKIVLLPQALGPFETPRVRRAFATVLRHADLIYARETTSFEHVRRIGCSMSNVRQAPDFTNLVSAELPSGFRALPRMACIVPNHRMVEKTTAEVKGRYVPVLADCVRELIRCGCAPTIVLHDSVVDETLVDPLRTALGHEIPVLREDDPRRLKGILGAAHVVVGSRFHALVGALSQNVPCIGIGWSHKYEMLFEDYDCPECLMPGNATLEEVRAAVKLVAVEPARGRTIDRISRASNDQKERTRQLWSEVDETLGLAAGTSCVSKPSDTGLLAKSARESA